MSVVAFWILILFLGGIGLVIAGAYFLMTDTDGGFKNILGTICVSLGVSMCGAGIFVWVISSELEAGILHKKISEIQTIEWTLAEGKLPLESTPVYEARLVAAKKEYEKEARRASSEDWDVYKELYIDKEREK